MERWAVIVGGWIAVVGILGVILKFFPPNDGAIAIAGAAIFGSGVVAKAIAAQKR